MTRAESSALREQECTLAALQRAYLRHRLDDGEHVNEAVERVLAVHHRQVQAARVYPGAA